MDKSKLNWIAVASLMVLVIGSGVIVYLDSSEFKIEIDGTTTAKYSNGNLKLYDGRSLIFADEIRPYYYDGSAYKKMYKARGDKYMPLEYAKDQGVHYIRQTILYSKGNLTRYFWITEQGIVKQEFEWNPIDPETRVYFNWRYEDMDSVPEKLVYFDSNNKETSAEVDNGVIIDWEKEIENIKRVERFENGVLQIRTRVYEGPAKFDPYVIIEPYVGEATIYPDGVYFNFDEEMCLHNERLEGQKGYPHCIGEMYNYTWLFADVRAYKASNYKGQDRSEIRFTSPTVGLDVSYDELKYKIAATDLLSNDYNIYGWEFNITYYGEPANYSIEGNNLIYHFNSADLHIDNDLLCYKKDKYENVIEDYKCEWSQSNGLPMITFLANKTFDPEFYLQLDNSTDYVGWQLQDVEADNDIHFPSNATSYNFTSGNFTSLVFFNESLSKFNFIFETDVRNITGDHIVHAETNLTLQTRTALNYNLTDAIHLWSFDNHSGTWYVDDFDNFPGFTTSGGWSEFNNCHPTYQNMLCDSAYLSASNGARWVKWAFNITETGEYELYENHRSDAAYATNAKYGIYSDDGHFSETHDQRVGGDSWTSLGTYNFTAGNEYYVNLSGAYSGTYLIADAVKIERIGEPHYYDETGRTHLEDVDFAFVNGVRDKEGIIDDYLQCGGNLRNRIVSTGTITSSSYSLSLWFKSADTLGEMIKFTEGASSDVLAGLALTTLNSGKFYFARNSETYLSSTQYDQWRDNKWHNLIGTWNGTDCSIYVDGEDVGCVYYSTGAGSDASLGANKTSICSKGSNVYSGSLDEIAIYDKALTAEEAMNVYHLGDEYIEWNDWQDEGPIENNTQITSTDSGNFMQYRAFFKSDDLAFSPFLISQNITMSEGTLAGTCPHDWIGDGTADSPCNVSTCEEINVADLYYQLNGSLLNQSGTCLNISANNIVFDGNDYLLNGDLGGTEDFGILAEGVTNITIQNVEITAFGDTQGLTEGYDGAGLKFSNTNNSKISNSHFANNSWGIRLIDAYDNTLDQFSISTSVINSLRLINSGSNLLSNFLIDYGDTGLWLDNPLTEDNVILNFNLTNQEIPIVWALPSPGNNTLKFNNSFGEIDLIGKRANASLKQNISFGVDVIIGNNSAYLNSSSVPDLDTSANITLYGIGDRGFTTPAILKDGGVCSDCTNYTSLTADTVIFEVTGFSTYTIGDSPSNPTYNFSAGIFGIIFDPFFPNQQDLYPDNQTNLIGVYNITGYGGSYNITLRTNISQPGWRIEATTNTSSLWYTINNLTDVVLDTITGAVNKMIWLRADLNYPANNWSGNFTLGFDSTT